MLQYNINGFAVYEYPAQKKEFNHKIVFFAQANGIPALTYRTLLEKLSLTLNCTCIAYDIRGMGQTTVSEEPLLKTYGVWDQLIEDHIHLYEAIKKNKFSDDKWVFAGHSLGAWLSLSASYRVGINSPILIDMPVLPTKIALSWFFTNLLKINKSLNPRGQKVRKRKIIYPSRLELFENYKSREFMKKWPAEIIYDYIDGCFFENEVNKTLHLRHDPNWEGLIFDEYPPAAWMRFIKIPWKYRKIMKPVFIVGSQSDTCNPKASLYVKFFFPKREWEFVSEGEHMFPFELQEETIKILVQYI